MKGESARAAPLDVRAARMAMVARDGLYVY